MATRTIGTELVLTGEKAFNDAMKGVNSNLKNLRAEMALNSAEFADNADSMEALTAKQKILQQSVDQHRAKVDALRKMYEEQKKKFGENSAAADKFKLQLIQAQAALAKEENALKKTTAALDEAAESSDNAADAAEDLAKEEKRAADGADDAAKAQARYTQNLERAERRSEALKNGLEKLGGATAAAAKATAAGVAAITAAGGVAIAGMINMAKEAADAAKAAAEAGEELTAEQKTWLRFSGQLDALEGSAANAKSAIAGILLPTLGKLANEGTGLLTRFSSEMAAAAGDTEKQTEILGKYIAEGAKLILAKLPDYIQSGKKLLSSLSTGLSESAPELLEMAEDLLKDFLQFVITKSPELAEGGLEMVLQLIEGIDGEDLAGTAAGLVSRLADMLTKYAPELIPAAIKLIGEFVVGLAKNAPMLLKSGADLLKSLIEGLLSATTEIPKVWREVLDVLLAEMRSSDSKIMQFGADVIEWIMGGILDAWDGLVTWFNNLWDDLFSGRDVKVNVNASGTASGVDGSHANGLRYVPFDGYMAQLHRGEAVLTAEEAAAYRSGKTGGKVFNLTINTKTLSQNEMDMLVDYMNRKMGDDL